MCKRCDVLKKPQNEGYDKRSINFDFGFFSMVRDYKNNKFYLEGMNHYAEHEGQVEIQFCPFCGEELSKSKPTFNEFKIEKDKQRMIFEDVSILNKAKEMCKKSVKWGEK